MKNNKRPHYRNIPKSNRQTIERGNNDIIYKFVNSNPGMYALYIKHQCNYAGINIV
jgi:hypothetical protein